MCNRTGSAHTLDGVVPEYKGRVNDVDGNLEDLTKLTIESYERLMDDLRITDAIAVVNELVNRANKYIDETEPWALAKNPEKLTNLQSVMLHLTNSIYVAGMLLKPVLVTASDKLFEQLGVSGDLLNYENIYKYGVTGGLKVEKKDQLFPRLDAAIEVAAIQEMMNANK